MPRVSKYAGTRLAALVRVHETASGRTGRTGMSATYSMPAGTRPLHRSNRHRVVAGVCGGLADWLGWDATLVRGIYVVASLLSAAFPGTLVYLILWIVMPRTRD